MKAKQYLAALSQGNYWRLFVDGFRQKSNYKTENTLGKFVESELGHLLWALREPNGLNRLKQTAFKLFNEQLNEELTFEFIQQVLESAYPFEDHLRLTTGYLLKEGERTFGYISKDEDREWIKNRAKQIKEIVGSAEEPWKIVKNFESGWSIQTVWTLEEKKKNYKILLTKYNEEINKAVSNETKIFLIALHMQDIECLHFSKDGNCRAMYLLLNKELMKHDIDPVVLFNPNDFDCSEPDYLVNKIVTGQKAFEKFVKTGTPYDDCISEEQIKSNIAKLNDEHVEVHGDGEELESVKSLEFTKKTLTIFNTIQSKYQYDNLREFWNIVLKTLLIYEYQLSTEQNPISSIEEFCLAFVTDQGSFKALMQECNAT